MEATQRHRLADSTRLAVTLAIFVLGLAIIAWEWRNAHTAAPLFPSDAAHHHGAQSNLPGVTPAERPK